ncbi:MAG: hypothetical protein A3G96_06865 [Gammaproteobacteria bacterium RIFCSPLOWO2_12_FULL_52_10]|nr:MAG: hypothetical protein A3G96_06865 [Gammaproteobacteria bacterium RIFCSPLOWO2_12_FULL_52_10]
MNIILRITVLLLLLPGLASAQTAAERRDKLGNMIMKHPGQSGALAPENMNKDQPAPPFNLTGTWFVDLSEGFAKFMFGPPYPEFIGQARLDFEEGQRMRAAGKPYRDAIGQCFPAGIPMIMTRVWPIAMVQLPTVIYMVANFNNSFRQIFLDGREYSDSDTIIYTYNGESLGHWEGDTLVVDTRYVETYNHYIDTGIPISEDFRVQERINLLENGEILKIEYIMTDPQGWVGEWRNTKQWLRVDETDINEVECLPDLNDNLPSTQAGEVGLER